MRKTLAKRREKFMPNGTPIKLRVYDNGGKTIDRYTVVFTGNYGKGSTWVLGMSGNPFGPQGFCQHCPSESRPDRPTSGHLGKKIKFHDLPEDCQKAVVQDYMDLWNLQECEVCGMPGWSEGSGSPLCERHHKE